MPSSKAEPTGLLVTDLSDNRKGDIAEIFVSNLALIKGAEVFRNAGCDGAIDMVLLIEGRFVPIDVKLAHRRKTCHRTWKPAKVNPNKSIYMVLVCPIHPLDMSQWEVRWHNTAKGCHAVKKQILHCPPGLEDFWSKDYRNTFTKPNE